MEEDVDKLRADIRNGVINSWKEVHNVYKEWDISYEKNKVDNA